MVFLKIVILVHVGAQLRCTKLVELGARKCACNDSFRAQRFRAVVTQFGLFIMAQSGSTISLSKHICVSKGSCSID